MLLLNFDYLKDLLEIPSRILERPAHPTEGDGYDSDDFTSNYGGYQSDYGLHRRGRKFRKRNLRLNTKKEMIKKAKKIVEKFNSDPNFKLLHECVSNLFAQKLRSDMKLLNSGDSSRINSAAKWCPSLDPSYEKTILLCETIAKKVFPLNEYPEDEGVEEAHFLSREGSIEEAGVGDEMGSDGSLLRSEEEECQFSISGRLPRSSNAPSSSAWCQRRRRC